MTLTELADKMERDADTVTPALVAGYVAELRTAIRALSVQRGNLYGGADSDEIWNVKQELRGIVGGK